MRIYSDLQRVRDSVFLTGISLTTLSNVTFLQKQITVLKTRTFDCLLTGVLNTSCKCCSSKQLLIIRETNQHVYQSRGGWRRPPNNKQRLNFVFLIYTTPLLCATHFESIKTKYQTTLCQFSKTIIFCLQKQIYFLAL